MRGVNNVILIGHVIRDAELRHTVGEQLGRLSEKELTSRVRAITYRLDAQAVVDDILNKVPVPA